MSTFSIKVPVFQKQIADHHKYKDQILDLIKINSMGYIKKGDVVDIISDYDLSRNHPRPYLSLVTDRVMDCLVDFEAKRDFMPSDAVNSENPIQILATPLAASSFRNFHLKAI